MILDTQSEVDGKQVWLMNLQGQNMILAKTFERICIDKNLEHNWRHKWCVLQSKDHEIHRQRWGIGLGQIWEIYPKVKLASKQTSGIEIWSSISQRHGHNKKHYLSLKRIWNTVLSEKKVINCYTWISSPSCYDIVIPLFALIPQSFP